MPNKKNPEEPVTETAEAPENNTYCIYCHTNLTNNFKYIGQTIHGNNANKRWRNGEGYKDQVFFYRAIKKYGWDNFSHEILRSNLTLEEANYWENYYIELYRTFAGFSDAKGYNLTLGGDGLAGVALSAETKKKISNSEKGKKVSEKTKEKMRIAAKNRCVWNKEKPLSEEHKKKISESHKGKKLSPEAKEKLSKANKGKIISEETRKRISETEKGKKVSDETREKLRIINTGKTLPDEVRQKISNSCKGQNSVSVIAINKVTGEELIFNSIVTASNELKINKNGISNNLRNRTKTCGGYIFKYLLDKEAV